jgi:hypothetical protein
LDAYRARRWVPLTLVGAMIGAAAVAASLATPGARSIPEPEISFVAPRSAATGSLDTGAGITAQPRSSRAVSTMEIPQWLQTVVGYICAVLGIAVFGYLTWLLIRMALETRAKQPATPGNTDDVTMSKRRAVLAAVDAGIAELASEDGDARSAVIACWVRLEEVAAAAGTPRSTSDSAADLVHRLLHAHQVSAPVLESLAELYRAARYGTHEIDPSMRARARHALSQLRDELARSRSGPLEHDAVLVGPAEAARRPRPSAPRPDRGDDR